MSVRQEILIRYKPVVQNEKKINISPVWSLRKVLPSLRNRKGVTRHVSRTDTDSNPFNSRVTSTRIKKIEHACILLYLCGGLETMTENSVDRNATTLLVVPSAAVPVVRSSLAECRGVRRCNSCGRLRRLGGLGRRSRIRRRRHVHNHARCLGAAYRPRANVLRCALRTWPCRMRVPRHVPFCRDRNDDNTPDDTATVTCTRVSAYYDCRGDGNGDDAGTIATTTVVNARLSRARSISFT